jgi:hypothetical protein
MNILFKTFSIIYSYIALNHQEEMDTRTNNTAAAQDPRLKGKLPI